MPSPTTALEIIGDALGLTNAVGVDQTLTAKETSDCLRAFNDLLEIFSTKSLAVYGSANQTFNTVVGQSVYTIGGGGNWNTARPARIVDPGYATYNGFSFPVYSMTQDEYNAIGVKTQTQDFPERYLYVNDSPLGLVTIFPVPSAVVPITLSLDRLLTAVSSASQSISYPPGYAMVFKYKLAIMLAPVFGKKITNYPDVVKIATESFADIARANKKTRLLSYTTPAIGTPYQRFIGGY
jgi:hypothetical protein